VIPGKVGELLFHLQIVAVEQLGEHRSSQQSDENGVGRFILGLLQTNSSSVPTINVP
jgi:hypothetical protein